MTAPEIRHSPRGVSKPVICLLSGARRHTCLDYDPTVLGSEPILEQAPIKIFMHIKPALPKASFFATEL